MSDCYGLQMVREGDELGSNAKNGPHPLCSRASQLWSTNMFFLVKSDQMDYCVQKIINSIKIWINFIFYQTNFFVSHVMSVVCNGVRG